MGVKNQNVKKGNTMGMIIKFKVKGQGQGHYYYCYSPIAHSCIPYLETLFYTLLLYLGNYSVKFWES